MEGIFTGYADEFLSFDRPYRLSIESVCFPAEKMPPACNRRIFQLCRRPFLKTVAHTCELGRQLNENTKGMGIELLQQEPLYEELQTVIDRKIELHDRIVGRIIERIGSVLSERDTHHC